MIIEVMSPKGIKRIVESEGLPSPAMMNRYREEGCAFRILSEKSKVSETDLIRKGRLARTPRIRRQLRALSLILGCFGRRGRRHLTR